MKVTTRATALSITMELTSEEVESLRTFDPSCRGEGPQGPGDRAFSKIVADFEKALMKALEKT